MTGWLRDHGPCIFMLQTVRVPEHVYAKYTLPNALYVILVRIIERELCHHGSSIILLTVKCMILICIYSAIVYSGYNPMCFDFIVVS